MQNYYPRFEILQPPSCFPQCSFYSSVHSQKAVCPVICSFCFSSPNSLSQLEIAKASQKCKVQYEITPFLLGQKLPTIFHERCILIMQVLFISLMYSFTCFLFRHVGFYQGPLYCKVTDDISYLQSVLQHLLQTRLQMMYNAPRSGTWTFGKI